MEEIGLDGLSAIDTENITSMDDLIRGIAPSEDVDVDEADAVSSEMLTFIEQYKELLSLMSTLNMEDIAKNMPSAGQLSQVVSKALEGADTASGVEQLNQAMSELSGAIESAVTASSEDKEKLDQAAQDMASAVEGFIQAYRSIGGVFEGQDGGTALKEAVASLEGWNPFASFSAGASDAASQVEGISAAVDTVSEKQVGDLGAQQTANDLQKIISKLNEIKDYKIPAKTVQVSVQRTSAVPSNAKGTEDSPGGQSFVAEEGRELIYRKNAGKVELANSMQLTTLEPGDQVIPHAETERILRRRDMTAYDGYAKGTKSNKKLKKELEKIEEA